MGTEEENARMEQYHERVTKVETQLAYVLVEQSNLRTILDKHNTLIEALAKQATAQEYQTKAIVDRTDAHTKEIERLQSGAVDTGKLMNEITKLQEGFRVQLRIAQSVGAILLTLAMGYFFSIFVK